MNQMIFVQNLQMGALVATTISETLLHHFQNSSDKSDEETFFFFLIFNPINFFLDE